jgi:hypothetical protein
MANHSVDRKRTLRNSVLDLQQLYRAQLTTLWSTVEGSQKYLPLVPGRHLVFETHNFVELNPATYKAKQSVSLFLLSDLLLIAGRRRTKTAAASLGGADEKGRERGRMVAERCWVLADLVVIDVKDSGGELFLVAEKGSSGLIARSYKCTQDPSWERGLRLSHVQVGG